MRMPGYVMTQSRMMSPASATGPPLVAGQPGAAWIPTSSGSYIIQSPTGPPMNPNEVFHLSPSGRDIIQSIFSFKFYILIEHSICM